MARSSALVLLLGLALFRWLMGWSGCLKDVWVKTFSFLVILRQKIPKIIQKTPPLINLSSVLTGTHFHLVFFPGHCASWPDQPQSRCVARETAQWMSYARCFGRKGRKSLQIILAQSGLKGLSVLKVFLVCVAHIKLDWRKDFVMSTISGIVYEKDSDSSIEATHVAWSTVAVWGFSSLGAVRVLDLHLPSPNKTKKTAQGNRHGWHHGQGGGVFLNGHGGGRVVGKAKDWTSGRRIEG